MNKKIYIVTNADWFFLSHRLPIAIAAKQEGYEITIVANDTGKSSLITGYGFRFINLPMSRAGINPFLELKIVWYLYKLYKKERPDLVHHVALKAVAYGGLVAKWLNIPTVSAISGMGYIFTDSNHLFIQCILFEIFKYIFKRNSSILILQNYDDFNTFINKKIIDQKNLEIIRGSGVDCSKYKLTEEPSSDILKILFPARLLIDKGIKEFVGASIIIKQRGYTNIEFILAGDYDEGNPSCIDKGILNYWIQNNFINWIGHQVNMVGVFTDSNIVVLPSYREGLPKALIEAAAIGRAIISTDVPGCREVVKDGKNGFLIPPMDIVALADKIEILINNADLRKNMGFESRKIAERDFRLEYVVESTLSIYKKLLSPDYYD